VTDPTVVDADGCVLGRLASHVAKRALDGEEIRVVNAERALVTGSEDAVLEKYRDKREVGSQRKGPHHPRMPDRIFKRTVRGMLPYQQPRGREALRNVRAYIGVPGEFDGADPEIVDDARTRAHQAVRLETVSRDLGATF
jgi:large subunit ribosomal protein L13